MSMYTQCDCPGATPEKAVTRRLPTPALTRSGTTGASARISVSATMLPLQKRAIVGAGNVGFAIVARGGDDRDRPEEAGVRGHRLDARRVEEDRSERQVDRDVDRALERHVHREVELRRACR